MATKRNARRAPWNKGRIVGQKAPLKLREIWAIRVRLQISNNLRDLALFNLAIDSKLRACDLLSLRVADIAHEAYQLACHCHAAQRSVLERRSNCNENRQIAFPLAAKARAAGVPIELHLRQGQPHNYAVMPTPEGRQARAIILRVAAQGLSQTAADQIPPRVTGGFRLRSL